MQVEATVPDSRALALQELAEQLGLSKSQVIDDPPEPNDALKAALTGAG